MLLLWLWYVSGQQQRCRDVQGSLMKCRVSSQVLALSKGQQTEEDLLRKLVAAVADARRAAGTHGQERAGPGTGAVLASNQCMIIYIHLLQWPLCADNM